MISVFILRVLHILHYYIFVLPSLPHSRSFSTFPEYLKFLSTNKRYKTVFNFFLRLMNKRFLLVLIVQCYVDVFICRYFLTIKIDFAIAF